MQKSTKQSFIKIKFQKMLVLQFYVTLKLNGYILKRNIRITLQDEVKVSSHLHMWISHPK